MILEISLNLGVCINYGREGTNKSVQGGGGITKFQYPFMGGITKFHCDIPIIGGSQNPISRDLKIDS